MILLRISLSYKIETKIEKSPCYKKNRRVNVLKIRSNLIQETNSRLGSRAKAFHCAATFISAVSLTRHTDIFN